MRNLKGLSIESWETHRIGDLVLHIIWPIDSVKDRLAAGIHFNDLNSVRQAAEIAKGNENDLHVVKEWCVNDGGELTFRMFEAFLFGTS